MTITPENFSGGLFVDGILTGPAVQVTAGGTKSHGGGAPSHEFHRPLDASTELVEGRQGLELRLGETYRLDRVVALYTSRDTAEPRETARGHVERAIENVAGVISEHTDAWRARWQASDLRIDGDFAAQRALRFAIYHLLSAANPQDDRVSIGARGLSGTAYKGHVFWDTDIFMLPFFILTYPEAARALVMYRYHTLAAARAKAARLGYRGALYAWESAGSGEDATPPFGVAPDGQIIRSSPESRSNTSVQMWPSACGAIGKLPATIAFLSRRGQKF